METENFNPWEEDYPGQHNLTPAPAEPEPVTDEERAERLKREIREIEERSRALTLWGRPTAGDREIIRENDERL